MQIKLLLAALSLLTIAVVARGDELSDRLAAVPNPRQSGGWVVDPAGVIAPRTKDINAAIDGLEHDTSSELAVAVLPTIGHLNPKSFAVALFAKWGVGKAGKDNGVLVLHVLDQRRIEIETGYGMEGILPDAKCHWITQEIAVPFFKKGSYADGDFEVVRALIRAIEHPDIKHDALLAGVQLKPGATRNPLPKNLGEDAIARHYTPLPLRIARKPSTPLVLLGLGLALYLGIALVNWLRGRGKDPYTRYGMHRDWLSRLQYGAALPASGAAFAFEFAHTHTYLSPAPVLVALGFAILWRRGKVLQALRDAPRTCHCGLTMRRLSEEAEDAYLSKGNIAEESIDSIEYDVWRCESGHTAIQSYRGRKPASACPRCGYRTYRITDKRTIRPATTASTGLREVTFVCASCGLKKFDTVVIPRVATSSGRAGGSGGSGGSFGGGHSGGGGAGSSY